MRNKTVSFKYLLSLLLVVIALVIVLISTRPVKQPPLQPLAPLRVAVAAVQRMDLQPRLELTGYLRPVRKSTLRFELAGRVVARQVEAGHAVTAGALLLQLDDGDYRDAVAEAEARLAQERAAVQRDRRLLELLVDNRELQAREVARLQQLGQESLASKSKRDAARQRLLQLRAEEEQLRYGVTTAASRLALAEAALRRAQRNLGRTRLSAPYAAVVNAVFLQEGDYVTPAAAAVELVQLNELDLYLEVGGATLTALRRDEPVPVAVRGRRREGRIVAVQQDPDPRTFTHEVRIRIPGDGLLPGLPGRASLSLRPLRGVLVVPVAAVLRDDGESYVFVVEDGTARRRAVVAGRREGDWQVIRGGLDGSETVVARDVALLSDGQPVAAGGVVADGA